MIIINKKYNYFIKGTDLSAFGNRFYLICGIMSKLRGI